MQKHPGINHPAFKGTDLFFCHASEMKITFESTTAPHWVGVLLEHLLLLVTFILCYFVVSGGGSIQVFYLSKSSNTAL